MLEDMLEDMLEPSTSGLVANYCERSYEYSSCMEIENNLSTR
jgi:hypothetical protein